MTTDKTNTPPNKRRSFWEWLDDRYERFCSLPRMRQVVEGAGMFFAASIVILLFCHLTAEWVGYEKIKGGGNAALSPGVRFFRDLMVALAAVIGITIAAWRTSAFDRQSKTAAHHAEQSKESSLGERFATAAKLLAEEIAGNKPAIAARVSGMYIMEELASAHPNDFMLQTVKIMVAYIKDNLRITANPPLSERARFPATQSVLGEDVKTAFWVIQSLYFMCGRSVPDEWFPSPRALDFSHGNFSHLDLSEKQLPINWRVFKLENVDLSGANLQGASLDGANLTEAILHGANLSGIEFGGTILTRAKLQGANLEKARLHTDTKWDGANLSWASLRSAYLGINDWDARFFATDFSGATITTPPQKSGDRDALQGKIWHSQNPKLEGIAEQETDKWELDTFPSASALAGIFRNFLKDKEVDSMTPQARGLRDAANILRQRGGLPDIPKWIEKLLVSHVIVSPHE